MASDNPMVCFEQLGRVGRLKPGNALFQLASTAGIARRLGVEPRFNADWTHRPFFSVPDEYFVDDFAGCVPSYETAWVNHIDPRARVYLQDFELFAELMPVLRAWLIPSEHAIDVMGQHGGPQFFDATRHYRPGLAGVHVRRGDNIFDPGVPDKHNYHQVPPDAYYHRMIAEYRARGWGIAVFGDDPEWNREHLDGDYLHVGVPRPKENEPDFLTAPVLDWIDLVLLSRCDEHVISGSTFGIWAALLSPQLGPVNYWYPPYGPKLSYIDADLLFPKVWRRWTKENLDAA